MTRREYASFGMELARAEARGRTLAGYASVFNYPIETIESFLYGTTTYIRPGAFGRTLQENRSEIQVLFNHGHDPIIGEKPLGVPSVMREDAHGLYVEVPLDETSYNDDLITSLSSGALRAMSISFQAAEDDQTEEGSRSITRVRLFEFGPVTFPANQAATAALHSLSADLERHQVDDSTWDGNRAMGQCSSAADYRAICAGEKTIGESDERQHWALPHHYLAGPGRAAAPNANGVRNALARLPQTQNLANEGAARRHLEAHMSVISESSMGSGDPHGAPPTGSSVPNGDGLTLAKADSLRYERELAETEKWKEIAWLQRQS